MPKSIQDPLSPGPVRPARARSSHASQWANPDFGASEAAPGTVRGCYIVLHGAFDIVDFSPSKFVHDFRRKIDCRCTNRNKIDVQNDAKIDPKPPLSLSTLFSVQPGAFDIVAFARSKFVHDFRRKIDYPYTNRDK